MAKNLKLNIKNAQIAKALNLGSVKEKLAQKKASTEQNEEIDPAKLKQEKPTSKVKKTEEVQPDTTAEESPRIKARSKSVFAHSEEEIKQETEIEETTFTEENETSHEEEILPTEVIENVVSKEIEVTLPEIKDVPVETVSTSPEVHPPKAQAELQQEKPLSENIVEKEKVEPKVEEKKQPFVKLGPTGRHVKDLIPPKREIKKPIRTETESSSSDKFKAKPKPADTVINVDSTKEIPKKKLAKNVKFKEFRDVKPTKRPAGRDDTANKFSPSRDGDEFQRWRKKRNPKQFREEEATIRPSSLMIRLPIAIKDLASEMKLKASQLIEKLFLQGAVFTLNDILNDETTVQLLGQEFGCEISIDTTQEKRIQITEKTVKEEIAETPVEELQIRAPVVAFMGHVDHGKTSLIDAIRNSNRVAGEAGSITQHIGAFRCSTTVGDLTILDTPGHEAFSAMRARGADVTDICILVIAGDEGSMPQTSEAIQHAKAAGVTIVVAINKCDKPAFDAEKVYRQLADQNLLPEAWGGNTITINCSAKTGEGISTLLEMLALQAEVLELRASPKARARGAVIESEMHKGLGAKATLLVQNGTLKRGDALVFDKYWGYVKTMHDENGKDLVNAGPSTPVEITGLSGLPSAGQEFIVVESEKEARVIAEARSQILQSAKLQRRSVTLESLLTESEETPKKVLNVILRADVQGSMEALKSALENIETDKVNVNVIFAGVGEISESDVQLAAASKAVILGFHTKVESHAESLIKQYNVQVRLHDIIYHAVDTIKELMTGTLDKLVKEISKGKADVLATFKSSQHGVIAGCMVTDGVIQRNNFIRIYRDGEEIWKGSISSLKRHKDDVKEVRTGMECGILVTSNNIKEGDKIEAFEIIYIKQEL